MKKKKQAVVAPRNWAIVIVGSILIVIGLALVILAVSNIPGFGWWSIAVGLSGVSTIGAAVMSIVKNDPSWILLDLIIPG